jgi:serine/threonine-protein kinase
MGEVYRAHDTRLKRDVALKVLPASLADDPERIARFTREAEMLAALNHPHIAAIFGIEDATGTRALVMELVEGETLAERIARGPIPLDEAIAIARQIAEALEAAHEQGIVHRDLKPANIKLRDEGTVKVLDFGLAKLAEPALASGSGAALGSLSPTITSPALATHAGVLLGTAAYMSPEQAKGRPADKRSDIWAFGCVIFEMLTGTRPFGGEDVSDTLASVLKSDPDWSAVPADVPSHVTNLVRYALEKNPRKRLPDVSTVRFLLDHPPVAERSEAPHSIASPRSRWRTLSIAAAAALALIAVTIAVTMVAMRPAIGARPPVIRFAVPLPRNEFLSGTALPSIALSRDGRQMAYIAGNRLYVRAFAESGPREVFTPGPLRDSTALIYEPVFSPDGRSIAFIVGPLPTFSLRTMSVRGGVTTTLAEGSLWMGMSWGEHGIVFSDNGVISRVSTDGRPPERLIQLAPDEAAHFPSMLPDGETLLFALTSDVRPGSMRNEDWQRATVITQSLRTKNRQRLVTNASVPRYVPTGHLVYMSEGVLYARTFDARRLTVGAAVVPVVQGIQRGSVLGAAQVDISDAGLLAYSAGPVTQNPQAHQLVFITSDGQVDRVPLPNDSYVDPRVSPDGRRITVGIASGKGADVWIYELSGATAIRQLTFGGTSHYPLWSTDGQWIAFQSTREGAAGIYWQGADGRSPAEQLTKAEPGTIHLPEAFSPKGDYLLFASVKDGRSTLQVLTMSTRTVARFSDLESLAVPAAVFSPDGRWVAYGRRDAVNGNIALFVEPFPATGEKHAIVANGFRPLWHGDDLYYGTRGQSWVVKVHTTPQVANEHPRELPIRRYPPPYQLEREFDLLSDGRFIFSVPADSAGVIPREVQVVANWFEELKDRVR